MLRIGIDLGGTKIEGIALDRGIERARLRVDTPRDDYDATVTAIAGVVESLESRCGARGTVGIGIPGAIEPTTGLVKNANSVWLIGRPLGADLSHRLAREVRAANDANCFAISEATDGAGQGFGVVVGVILGTGMGSGVVVHGRVLAGANAVAGEIGHNPLPWPAEGEWPGPACYCGRSGCLETFLSGPALASDHAAVTGVRLSPPAIVAAAERGDPDASATLSRYTHRLARGLAAVVNLLDPDAIVLGGGLSNIARLYDEVPRQWGTYVFGCAAVGVRDAAPVRTRLLQARHGDASGVRGAAWLWPPG